MNKYEEALEVFAEHTRLSPHNIDGLQWADDVLQELVNKETPMIPINQYPIDFGLGNYGDCRVCNCGVNYQQNYCSECGQRLDWSYEE